MSRIMAASLLRRYAAVNGGSGDPWVVTVPVRRWHRACRRRPPLIAFRGATAEPSHGPAWCTLLGLRNCTPSRPKQACAGSDTDRRVGIPRVQARLGFDLCANLERFARAPTGTAEPPRSEEHTSELQSL